jgi:hypothetical protein
LPLKDNELPPAGDANGQNVKRFDQELQRLDGCPGFLLLYPVREELHAARHGKPWMPEYDAVTSLARKHHLGVIDVAEDPRWNESKYRDGIHPTITGNHVLAEVIGEAVQASKNKQP